MRRKGVEIEDGVIGSGAVATRDTVALIRCDGYLNLGEPFQASAEVWIDFARRNVVAGLLYGVEGMRVGGRRRIRFGPHLGYGDRGVPGVIPPNAVLIYDVELLEVAPNAGREGIWNPPFVGS